MNPRPPKEVLSPNQVFLIIFVGFLLGFVIIQFNQKIIGAPHTKYPEVFTYVNEWNEPADVFFNRVLKVKNDNNISGSINCFNDFEKEWCLISTGYIFKEPLEEKNDS